MPRDAGQRSGRANNAGEVENARDQHVGSSRMAFQHALDVLASRNRKIDVKRRVRATNVDQCRQVGFAKPGDGNSGARHRYLHPNAGNRFIEVDATGRIHKQLDIDRVAATAEADPDTESGAICDHLAKCIVAFRTLSA